MYGLSRREFRIALVISSSHFTQHVFFRILPPLIPVLAVALEYPLWQLGLLITLYSLGMGIAQAPLGVLSDRFDRRYLLPTGIALTGAAYVVFAFAPVLAGPLASVTVAGHVFEGGFLVMSLAMVLVGVGLAVVHPVGYPMITDNITPAHKGKVLGFYGAASKLGDATTPAIIAGLILVLAWQDVIVLFGLAGILYGTVLYLVLRGDAYETTPAARRNPDATERTTSVLDGDRRAYLYPITIIYLFFTTTGFATRGISTFLPAFLVVVYAFSIDIATVHVGPESVANLYFALLLMAGAATQLVLGGLTDRYDPRFILLCCMGVATAGLAVLAVLDLHPALLLVLVLVLGSGLYGVNPARDALISDLSPPDYEGRTFGYLFTAAGVTGAIIPTIIGYLLEALGMREGFLLLAAGTILAGVCIALLYSNRFYLPEPTPASHTDPSD